MKVGKVQGKLDFCKKCGTRIMILIKITGQRGEELTKMEKLFIIL